MSALRLKTRTTFVQRPLSPALISGASMNDSSSRSRRDGRKKEQTDGRMDELQKVDGERGTENEMR